MDKLSRIVALSAVAFSASLMSTAALAAYSYNNTYVDAIHGSDSANTCNVESSPCATLNKALLNTAAGGSVYVIEGAPFGPIVLRGAVSIIGPADGTGKIYANAGVAPTCFDPNNYGGCVGSSTVAVLFQGGNSDNVRIKRMTIITSNNGGKGAISWSTGNRLELDHVTIHGNDANTPVPLVDLLPNNPNNFPAFILRNSEVGENSSTGACIHLAPRNNTYGRIVLKNDFIHNCNGHLIFLDATNGASRSEGDIEDTTLTASNGNGVQVTAGSGSGIVKAYLVRTGIYHNTNAIDVEGGSGGGSVNLNSVTIGSNTIGVNVGNSDVGVLSIGNNFINGNSTNINPSNAITTITAY
jgi:hypothetical protein